MSAPSAGLTDNPLRGIAFALAGVIALSVMDGIAKWLVVTLSVFQLLAIRSAFNLFLLSPMVRQAGGGPALRTRSHGWHALRVLVSVAALICFFEALRHLPLATCIAIGFAAPLFMAVLSVVLLGERVGPHRWAAIVTGFLGVLVIVPPDADGLLSWAGGLMVVSSLLFGLSQVLVRRLARHETDAAILVYQNAGMLAVGVLGLPFVWVPISALELAGIAAMSVVLTIGQVCTVKAFRAAPVGVVAPFHYTELIWATLIGYVFWAEFPEPHVWAGAAIVVAAGLYMIWREAAASKVAAAV
jgi:drug/metabolite transporter (DMT)-like permease